MFMNIVEIINSSDKILLGIGRNIYRTDTLPEDFTDWNEIKHYLSNKCDNRVINQKLIDRLLEKDYFIVTSSWDSHLEEITEENRLFTPRGNCRKLQCYNACSTDLWDVNDFKDNTEHPRCPHCNSLLIMNITTDAFFVHENYDKQEYDFHHWIDENYNEKLLIIELEVDDDEVRSIRAPFENIVKALPNTTFLRINSKKTPIPDLIENGIEINLSLEELTSEI